MKKLLLVICCLSMFPSLKAGNIQAYLSYCTFLSPQEGPYIETYLSVYAKSIGFVKNETGKFQGSVGITLIFRQGEDIKDFRKYELKSPEVQDSTKRNFSFIDQQRVLLPEGEYEFELQIQDMNSNLPPLTNKENLKISYPATDINVSGIQLIEKYSKSTETSILTKSGYDFVPYIFNYYPKEVTKLVYYAEIYHTDAVFGADSKYLLSTCIQVSETGQPLSDFMKNRKETAKPVNIIFNEFDISRLPSGNYNLIVEVRNQENKVVSSNSVFFQRSNPDVQLDMKDIAALDIQGSFVEKMITKDTLQEYIRSLAPISTEIEKVFAENQMRSADIKTLQQYFLNFWQRREPLNPERSWLLYKEQVYVVDNSFRTPIKKGYETDRGRIYLKYGPPNTIADQPFEASNSGLSIGDGQRNGDNGVVPYQIWHYYRLRDNQRDKKFVFANPNIATNDYALIHSNVSGELNNPNWQSDLIRQVGILDKDEVSPKGRFGSKSGDLYNNPR